MLIILKQLLKDLLYLHKKFNLYHEALNCDTILLDFDERMKINKFNEKKMIIINEFIINVDDSIIKSKRFNLKNEKNDIQSIESIMMKLIKSEIFILESNFIVLKNMNA